MRLLPGLTPDASLRLRGVVTGRADWRALCHACDRLRAHDGVPAEEAGPIPGGGRGPEIRQKQARRQPETRRMLGTTNSSPNQSASQFRIHRPKQQAALSRVVLSRPRLDSQQRESRWWQWDDCSWPDDLWFSLEGDLERQDEMRPAAKQEARRELRLTLKPAAHAAQETRAHLPVVPSGNRVEQQRRRRSSPGSDKPSAQHSPTLLRRERG